MRPVVEASGFVYIDNYVSTFDAAFQPPATAIKFARNSAFHYLDAGRHLMAQLLFQALQLFAPRPQT